MNEKNSSTHKLTEYVDPFIGVDGGGNCLCGPYLPLSIARPGPDTYGSLNSSGYHSDQPIMCFSQNHVSGTGGGSRYGNFGIIPFTGEKRFNIEPYHKIDEYAEAGYYTVTLLPHKIKAELTVTPKVAIHRYSFPKQCQANILIDASTVMKVSEAEPADCIGGFIECISNTEIVGRSDCKGGWGHQFPYSVYFYAKFDKPCYDRLLQGSEGVVIGSAVDGPNCKAIFTFNEDIVNLKVGISYVSIAKARASYEREAANKDFDTIRKEADEIWEQSLSRIKVEGGTYNQRKLFYTLFTRLICMPSDLGTNDENNLWESGVRNFTDYYCLWDSVRNANSLISLFDPELEVDMLNCLMDVADHIGWLPDAWVAGHSAMIQGGSSADILLNEASIKGLKGIDYNKALLHMRKNNEVVSPNPFLYGRHLKEYTELGYLSTNIKKNCVSRHMEYSYQDWCIGNLAKQLGQMDIAEKYFESSKKLWNLWREDIKFFAPKDSNGNWVEFDPAVCLPDCWNDPYFYEGTSWQWSFSTHHDFRGLIERHGGNEEFVKHLDRFFDEGHYYSKETMLHIPYLYIYAGRPDKTAERVHSCLNKYFEPARNGLKDNEDMGCQSAFYMCSSMGLYPIMGQDIYMLTTPVFKRTEIVMGRTGNKLIIEAPDAGGNNLYVEAVTINGKTINRSWIKHGEIAEGAVICFKLSDHPTEFGTRELPA